MITYLTIADLPDAVAAPHLFAARLAGRRPVVFLDYDGVLTPLVDRPQDALISDDMRGTVRALATRCRVCVVSGRDRAVVQALMGIDDLVVVGNHGFDIASPDGTVVREVGVGVEDLVAEVHEQVGAALVAVPGVIVEAKRASVAVHYRLASPADRVRIRTVVDVVLARHPGRLRLTPGKMVYELQPAIEWDKGRAVLYLLETLGLDSPGIVAIYLGADVTDEDAFTALHERGIGVVVGRPDDPDVAGRITAADFALRCPDDVERFLAGLAR